MSDPINAAPSPAELLALFDEMREKFNHFFTRPRRTISGHKEYERAKRDALEVLEKANKMAEAYRDRQE